MAAHCKRLSNDIIALKQIARNTGANNSGIGAPVQIGRHDCAAGFQLASRNVHVFFRHADGGHARIGGSAARGCADGQIGRNTADRVIVLQREIVFRIEHGVLVRHGDGQ
ncbi:hypothetical protein SDC9_168110 [bioreactor metagenome]|uniref:Uncharacterized protein n=1 Tax=bioreactor metagenome TaxID=1076179 RepID=A0A645G1N6_9ZZZZ